MSTILVTGGTGFIGSNLAGALFDAGHEVIITGVQTEQNPKAHRVLGHGLSGINYDELPDIDILFHQAANNDTLCEDINEMIWANVTCPTSLFNICLEAGCKQFIYASSTAVYGNEPAPYLEDETPLIPLNAYGKSKMLFEQQAELFGKSHGVNVIGLRYCNVYGPGESHKGHRASMIYQMAKHIFEEKTSPSLFRDGHQRRDYIHVDDVVQANLAAMNYQGVNIFNVGSGEATSFLEVLEYLNNFFCGISPYRYGPAWIDNPYPESYQSYTRCDIKKAAEHLGWAPQLAIHQGIEKYLQDSFPSTSL